MKKTVLIACLFIGVSNFFSQETERLFKKGAMFSELSNLTMDASNPTFSSGLSLGYGYFHTNRLVISSNFDYKTAFLVKFHSLNARANFQYYFSDLRKRSLYYGKLSFSGGIRSTNAQDKNFLNLSISTYFGKEYQIGKKTSFFIEGGLGLNKNYLNKGSTYSFGPKANIGFKFYF